jgi:hypothetical protein
MKFVILYKIKNWELITDYHLVVTEKLMEN